MRLNSYQRGSIFGLTLACVAFAFALATVPERQLTRNMRYQQTQTANDQGPKPEPWWRAVIHWSVKDASGFFTMCLVGIGLGQVYLFWRQLGSISDGLDLTRKQVDAYLTSEAPLLRISDYMIGGNGLTNRDHVLKIPDMPAFIFDVRNVGKGYAEPVSYRCGTVVARKLPARAKYRKSQEVRPDTILMNAEKTTLIFWFDLNGNERQRMHKAAEFLWVFGIVSYLDQFGRTEQSKFCVKATIDLNQEKTLFRFSRNRAPEPETEEENAPTSALDLTKNLRHQCDGDGETKVSCLVAFEP